MNSHDRTFADLKARARAHFAAGEAEAAARAYAEAVALVELPRGGLATRHAAAWLKAGAPDRAAEALMPVADAAPSFRTWATAAGLLARCPVESWPRIRRTLRLGLLSTWTTASFAPLLRLAAARQGVALQIHEPPFGQYFNASLDPAAGLPEGLDAVLLAPDPRALGLPAFSDAPEAEVEAACARFAAPWEGLRRSGVPLVVQMGLAPPLADPLGHLGAGLAGSRLAMARAVDRGLAARAAAEDVGYLDMGALAARLGAGLLDDRGWYMAKMPFAPEALPVLARHAAAVIAARLGLARRALVLDLDNTLWGGVIGDDGLEGIELGGGAAGEAYVDFQAALKERVGRGIVLAVASKNDPEVALRPFREHPEMVLREADVAVFEAGWGPKSEAIRRIAGRLALGLDALVFLDDNPYERAEVRRALPEVDVPLLPEDPAGYRAALEAYPYLEPAAFTAADRDRAGQYKARAAAEALRETAGSLEAYQASLRMRAEIGPVTPVALPRVVQLVNKTNQFNLTTIRRSRAELAALLARPGVHALQVRLADSFADHGLILVAIAVVEGEALEIDTLLMSCRVLGRGVEATVMGELARIAQAEGCTEIRGRYLPTARNGMVADLYPRLGFAPAGEGPGGETRWTAAPAALTNPGVPIEVVRA